MGLKDWRTRHAMRDPVHGEFQVTGSYFAHPGGSSQREMLTGVVTGPGVTATAGECLSDLGGRWVTHKVLPVLVDRSDPARFSVLWDEVTKPDWRAQAREQAAQAAQQLRSAGPGAPPGGTAPSAPGAEVPGDRETAAWAESLLAGLAGTSPGAGPPVASDGGTHVISVSGGHLSSAAAASLCASGEPATAIITAVSDVPLPPAVLPGPTASLCDLTLEVTCGSGARYQATVRQGFRSAGRRAEFTGAGAVLPVRIDPADRSRVAIDVPAFDRQRTGF